MVVQCPIGSLSGVVRRGQQECEYFDMAVGSLLGYLPCCNFSEERVIWITGEQTQSFRPGPGVGCFGWRWDFDPVHMLKIYPQTLSSDYMLKNNVHNYFKSPLSILEGKDFIFAHFCFFHIPSCSARGARPLHVTMSVLCSAENSGRPGILSTLLSPISMPDA